MKQQLLDAFFWLCLAADAALWLALVWLVYLRPAIRRLRQHPAPIALHLPEDTQ